LLSMAVSPQGDIGLLDSSSGRVHVLSATGTLRFSTPAELPGVEPLLKPQGLAFGDDGEIFVADTGNQRVVQFTPRGEVRLLGQAGIFSGQFTLPTALVWSDGYLYVLDSALCRVNLFAPDGTFVASTGGRGTHPGRFRLPTSLAIDETGQLLVIDSLLPGVTRFDSQLTLLQASRLETGTSGFPLSRAAVVGNGLTFYLSKQRQELLVFFENTFIALLQPSSLNLADVFWTDICARENRLYLLDARRARVDLFELE
ncbi:MAG TPA: NHL repeat-containing protein, partial [Candidatus Ozemobacteraceae bacterium]|nr:NHL repeat-containing protein [Candidatus Ozemobacteraceae bacterium]